MSQGSPFRLVLDTHIWYWYVAGSPDLPDPLRDTIDDALGSCWLSPISLWELGVLVSKRRIRLHADLGEWLGEGVRVEPVPWYTLAPCPSRSMSF